MKPAVFISYLYFFHAWSRFLLYSLLPDSYMPIHLAFFTLHITQLYPISNSLLLVYFQFIICRQMSVTETRPFYSCRLTLDSPWVPLGSSRGCPSRPTASLRAPQLVSTVWAGEDVCPTPVSTHSGSASVI